MVLAVIFLNLAGGDCVGGHRAVGARRRLFGDPARNREGFAIARRTAVADWGGGRARTGDALAVGAVGLGGRVPRSELAQGGRGKSVHSGGDRGAARPLAEAFRRCWSLHEHQPAKSATLDMGATLIETHKRDALHRYKKFKAYQPLNCWWAEQGAMLYSEFRDGNAPAGHEQLRVLKQSLGSAREREEGRRCAPDTAGY